MKIIFRTEKEKNAKHTVWKRGRNRRVLELTYQEKTINMEKNQHGKEK